ncbi:MAG: matrixin family metalloprotease [Actinomycetota bacterium]|nr:matrixin family metalloprotease [Actinomycetota bacterium]
MRKAFLMALVVVAATLVPAGTAAAAKSNTYTQAIHESWSEYKLDVIVVPPPHGQIYNSNGPLGGGDPAEATPFNSYVAAVEDSVAQWDKVIDTKGPRWMRKTSIKTYVVGRDEIPESVQQDPEAVIVYNEHQTFILGVTFSFSNMPAECLISNSMFFLQSFNYTDMYSVNLHEFGHCLGLEHTVAENKDATITHEMMAPAYPHDPGAAGTHFHCISNLNLKGVQLAFAEAFGRPRPNVNTATVEMTPAQYRLYPCGR